MTETLPERVLDCQTLVGEGPIWDQRSGTLYFVDIKKPAIWQWIPHSRTYDRFPLKERIGFVALTQTPGVLLCGMKSGLVLHRLSDASQRLLIAPEPDCAGNRINDGMVDLDGAVIFGTMDDAEQEPSGKFYRWHPQDGLTTIDDGYIVSNGPTAHTDGRRFFCIDTVNRRIKCFHRNDSGFTEPKIFFEWPDSWGYPDGMICDAEGGLWVAHWDGYAVTRLTDQGEVDRTIRLPARNITKPCFGGEDLSTLYLTTAAIDCDEHDAPDAGALFAIAGAGRGIAPTIAAVSIADYFE